MMALSKKQRLFIDNYLQCWNATQAAKDAGYSERTAYSIGPENLNKPEIAEEVERRLAESAMSADEALDRLGNIARNSIEEFIDIDEDGHIKLALNKAKEAGVLHLVKGIVPTANGLKLELHDSLRALELIAKHHGLFTDKVDITTGGEKLNNDNPERHDRAISTFADAIGKIISGQGAEEQGAVDTTKRTSVDGAPIES